MVQGLTTAAGVWATAGVGMACGGGLWWVAIVSAIILVLLQWFLHGKMFRHRKVFSIKIIFIQTTDEREQIKKIFDIDRYNKLVVERKDSQLIYQAIIDTDIEYSSAELDEIMKKNEFVCSIERYDNV